MMAREHILKCWPEFFELLWTGDKRFELRRDDRGYQAGDVLEIQEWGPQTGYSGRRMRFLVTYLLGGAWGLEQDVVCMSLQELARQEATPDGA